MRNKLFATTIFAGMFIMGCSDDSDVAGVVEDSGIVAEMDTVFVHDTVTVKKTQKDTVVVKDTVDIHDTVTVKKTKRDTIVVKDTINTKDTIVVKDTVNTKDTIEVRDTVYVPVEDEQDTGRVVSKGSISGFSQKGPFAKGASVTVFELDGTNELRQTGRSFNGTVSADDGAFKIKNLDLVSSYVHLTVNGDFRSELTGNKAGPITLRALSDLSDDHTNVNVNLITHLEYDRVAYLLEKNPTMTLVDAKKQAEKEIFAQFFIDGDKFGYAEDLNIFGTEDANAALLALSAMLIMDINTNSIPERLTALSDDMAEDGKIDDQQTMNFIAVRAMVNDVDGELPKIRNNVLSWGISEDVPNFEKFVRNFWQRQLGFGECGSTEFPVGMVVEIPDGALQKAGVPSVNKGADTRYICVDSASVGKIWRMAENIEKDTMGLGRSFEDGFIQQGLVNKDSLYVFDNGAFRSANDREKVVKDGCTIKNENKTAMSQYSAYLCTKGEWEFDSDNSYTGTVKDAHNENVYKTVGIGSQVWMAENVNYDFGYTVDNWYCLDGAAENCDKYGSLYYIEEAHDGVYLDVAKYQNPTDDDLHYCGVNGGRCELDEEHQGVCPDGFHIPSRTEYTTLMNYVDLFNGEESVATSLKSTSGWDNDANGTDRFGFNALPAGWYEHGRGRYYPSGVEARFWTKLEGRVASSGAEYYFDLGATDAKFVSHQTGSNGMWYRLYVRCVKNSVTEGN